MTLRSRVSLGVALLLGATLAACGSTTAPPQNLPAPTATPTVSATNTTTATLSTSAPTTFSTISTSGISDSATLPAASVAVSVTETIGTGPFDGDAALSAKRVAAAQRQIADAALSATAYVQFSSTQSVTVTGTTTITFTLPSVIAGDSYYLAVYQNGAWVAPAAGPGTVSGNTVTFSGNNGTTTISPTTPLELALYATTAATPTPTASPTFEATPTPTPTPTPVPTPVASPNSLLFDASNPTTQNFTVSEAGDLAAYTAGISCSTAPSAGNFVAELTSTTATPVQTGSGAATFTVQGGDEVGTCTVTVTDANSATAAVAVTVDSSTITVSGHARAH
jgi:hypothetical protein